MLFHAGNTLAVQIAIAGWAVAHVGLAWRLMSLRASARPATRRNPYAMLFMLIQSAAIPIVFWGPWNIISDAGSRTAQVEIGAVAALTLLGVWLFVSALLTLGLNFSAQAQVREAGRLVTTGPYALVRNPIYLAYFMLVVASGLAMGNMRNLLLGVVVYLLGAALRILNEERVLRAHFGEEYDAYAARVRRLIPLVW